MERSYPSLPFRLWSFVRRGGGQGLEVLNANGAYQWRVTAATT